jgi:hypothetical protein
MITVSKDDEYISYKNIKDSDSKIIFYPELFKGEIFNKIINNLKYSSDHYWIVAITIGLWKLTNKIYTISKPKYYSGPIAVFFLEDTDIKIPEPVHCKKSSIMLIGSEFLQKHDLNTSLPDSAVQFALENYLPDIYINTKNRLKYSSKIYNKLKPIRDKGEWNQCPGKEFSLKMLGKGCYGNVYKASKNSFKFAIKFSKLTKESLKTAYSLDYMCWYEAFFLSEIFKPIITDNICPNLPLIHDRFTCEKYKLTIKGTEEEHPCVVTAIELANGDLKQYLNTYITPDTDIDLLYSVLFQIMAALWAIQKYAQIIHYDIKKENILFYKIRPGGYFQYRILNTTFYVPNHGYLFILNDFGLSRSVSPEYPMYRSDKDKGSSLGSRYAYIEDGKFIPINMTGESVNTVEISWVTKGSKVEKSRGCDFSMSRNTHLLFPNKIGDKIIDLDFFSNPEITPPFEFYNDTQDAIRMFTGGKRTTQSGFHSTLKNIPTTFTKLLKKYIGPSESMKTGKHSTSPTNSKKFGRFTTSPVQVLAGYFIRDFYTKNTNYTIKQEGKIIGRYDI